MSARTSHAEKRYKTWIQVQTAMEQMEMEEERQAAYTKFQDGNFFNTWVISRQRASLRESSVSSGHYR